MLQNVPLSVFSSQRFIIDLGNNSWSPFNCRRWSLRKPSDLHDSCRGRSDSTESFRTAVFKSICFNLFAVNETYYCLYICTNIHTVSHKNERTPHISANLLYLFMGQHWRNDTSNVSCKVVSVQLVKQCKFAVPSKQLSVQPLMSKPLATKVSTPLSENVRHARLTPSEPNKFILVSSDHRTWFLSCNPFP